MMQSLEQPAVPSPPLLPSILSSEAEYVAFFGSSGEDLGKEDLGTGAGIGAEAGERGSATLVVELQEVHVVAERLYRDAKRKDVAWVYSSDSR